MLFLKSNWNERRFNRRERATVALLIIVFFGLAINFFAGLILNEAKLVYPIDRLRLSMGVALSRMRVPPISGYVAYGSIDRYLRESGFSYDHDEAEIRKLLNDASRVEAIWRAALSIKIDPAQPNVTFTGSDLGYSDFISDSFALFGIHPDALYFFYFLLLSLAVLLFLVRFWYCATALWVLGTYLAAELLIVIYAAGVPSIESIASTRAMPSLALLPALHLVLQSSSREKTTFVAIAASCAQCLILGFVLFCRFDAVVLIVASLGALGLGAIAAITRRKVAPSGREWRTKLALFLLAIAIFGGMQLRQSWMLRADYEQAPERHLVWDSLLSSVFTYDSSLFAEYTGKSVDQEHLWDEDQIPCLAILHYYQEKYGRSFAGDCTRVPPPGLEGQYDRLGFELAMRILRVHPAIIFKLFEQSPRQQARIWSSNGLFDLKHTYPAILLATVVLLVFAWSRQSPGAGFDPILLSLGMLFLFAGALTDPLITPSPGQTGALAMLFLGAGLLGGAALLGGARALHSLVSILASHPRLNLQSSLVASNQSTDLIRPTHSGSGFNQRRTASTRPG
jgi:hypothetical protein